MFRLFDHPPNGLLLRLFKLTRHFRSSWKQPPDQAVIMGLAEQSGVRWYEIVDAGTALLDAARFKDADLVFERGLRAFPDDPVLRIRHALSANNSGSYAAAIERWQTALRVAPDRPICRVGLAANYREIGEIAAADGTIAEALRRWPNDADVISEAARIAESDGRFAEAFGFFARLIARRNPDPDWLRGHAHALILLGRFEDAKAAIAAALARHPDDHRLLAVEAMLASAQEDWPRAVALWSAYRRRFPNDQTGWEHYGRAIQSTQLDQPEVPVLKDPSEVQLLKPVKVEIREDEELRQLLLGFESIGDSCEFGLVQRRYEAEPLGLLRWNDVALDNLLAALGHRFAGMGEEKHTELPTLENGEFVVKDRRWSLWMHTFMFQGQVQHETLYPKMCRRVIYLRDKLLADLTAAEKIFVYRSPGLHSERVEILHGALSAYGPIRLLIVQPVFAETAFRGEPGEIIKIGERRYVGFLRRLGVAEGNYWDIAYEDWVSICRAAVRA